MKMKLAKSCWFRLCVKFRVPRELQFRAGNGLSLSCLCMGRTTRKIRSGLFTGEMSKGLYFL